MPTLTDGYMYVLYYEDEENVMTAKQAAAAKAKGWKLYHCPGLNENGRTIWQEYEGGTGIGEIQNSKLKIQNDADAIYDLDGRRVNGQWSIITGQLPRGLYIVNGKKILK